jgi:hypothetical protein
MRSKTGSERSTLLLCGTGWPSLLRRATEPIIQTSMSSPLAGTVASKTTTRLRPSRLDRDRGRALTHHKGAVNRPASTMPARACVGRSRPLPVDDSDPEDKPSGRNLDPRFRTKSKIKPRRVLPNQRNRLGPLACGQREISRGRSQTVACWGGGSTPRCPTGTWPPWVHPDGRGDL